MLDADGSQEPVDLRRTDLEEFFLKSLGQGRGVPFVMGEPVGQRRLQEFAAGLLAGQPDGLEHGQHLRWLVGALGARALGRSRGQGTVQKPQGGLAMIAAGGAKLIEDARLVRPTGAAVAAVNAGQGLAFGGQTYVRGLGNHESESTYRRTPRPTPRPGNI